MTTDKYHREVSLLCPTCGGTQFEYGDDIDSEHARVRCVSCNRELTKEELIEANAQNLQAHAEELGKEAIADIADETRKRLQAAFRGNKYIKIR